MSTGSRWRKNVVYINISQSVHAYLKESGVPHIWNVDDEGPDAQDLGQQPLSLRAADFPLTPGARRKRVVRERVAKTPSAC